MPAQKIKNPIFEINFYLRALLIVLISLTQSPLHSKDNLFSDPPDEFEIHGFTVHVTEVNNLPERIPQGMRFERAEKIKGNGFIMLCGNSVLVDYSVKLKWNREQGKLIATDGRVSGKERKLISYNRGIYSIALFSEKLLIQPEEATCKARITFRSKWFATEDTEIVLLSEKCNLNARGSLHASNFKSSGTFMLKSNDYSISLAEGSSHVVNIENFPIRHVSGFTPVRGRFVHRPAQENLLQSVLASIFPEKSEDIARPFEGVVLNGNAKYATHNSYNFNCSINTNGASRFAVYLVDEIEKETESGSDNMDGYVILLKSGLVNINYENSELSFFQGKYKCDITLPTAIKHYPNSEERIVLKNQTVFSDEKGALRNYINLIGEDSEPYVLQIIQSNLLLTSIDTGAYVYFPRWAFGGSGIYLKNGRCEDLITALDDGFPKDPDQSNDIFQRPGITLHSGMISLFSEQVDWDGNPGRDTIKAHFKSNLTCTPYGITGSIATPGSSFIPVKSDDDDSYIDKTYLNPSWEEVLNAGDTLPSSPKALFHLEGMNILEMKLQGMNICLNKMESSLFKYMVHFKHPSFINVSFADTSFNGYAFMKATGPDDTYFNEAPMSFPTEGVLFSSPPRTRVRIRPTGKTPNPEALILWGWRLPVTFADHSIKIDYLELKENIDSAISVRIDLSHTNDSGKIQNSEIWIPSLYSRNSSLKCGVRFDANIFSTGDFDILNWDEYPYFGSSNKHKFDVHLSVFKKTESLYDPVDRSEDFHWEGKIQLPFFSEENMDSWPKLQMNTKDFIPGLDQALKLPMTTYKEHTCCSESDIETACGSNENPFSPLRIGIEALKYSYERNNFYSTNYTAYEEMDDDALALHPGRLNINSYTDAILFPSSVNTEEEYVIRESSNCNNRVKEYLQNVRSSETIKDLICFDKLALKARIQQGDTGSCCGLYYLGDYVVSSNDQIVFFAEDARYYPNGNGSLQFESSNVKIYSEESREDISLNIPGVKIEYTAEGILKASIGATLTSMSKSLPYECEFRFMMDPNCGYFYFLGAGSFTYFVRFTGLVFIMHAPFSYLEETETFYYTSILEALRIRTLHHDLDDFLDAMQFDEVNDETVITGCFLAGGASWSIGFEGFDLDLALGTGSYFFQFADASGEATFRSGIYMNAQAEVDLFLLLVRAYLELRATLELDQNTESYANLVEAAELELKGILGIMGCASIKIGHCSANAQIEVSFNTSDGFSFEGTDITGDCGWGDCPE